MTLLTRGREKVEIYPEVESVDERGEPIKIPSPTPVELRCIVHPITSNTALAQSRDRVANYRIVVRDAPFGKWARLVWRGRDWDIVGEPLYSNASRATRHVSVIIRAREL